MVTTAYVFLVIAVALQRLLETRISRDNERMLKARGAIEHAREQLPYMVALHTTWLVAALGEVLLFDRYVSRPIALLALLVFCVGQALRLLAIHALAERWTVSVVTLPGEAPVEAGIFRYLRHPNYLGVILEIAALPLVHGAYLTAIVFSVANGLLLRRRIQAEEQALGADYQARLGGRPKLVPAFVSVLRMGSPAHTPKG